MMERLLRIVQVLENLLLTFMMSAMVLVAVVQIALRQTDGGGLLWADTFLRVLVLWLAMAGAVVASRQRNHISIDLASKYLPDAWKRYSNALTALFTAAVCSVLVWYTAEFVRIEREAPSIAFGVIPTWVCEAVLPAGFALIALRYLINAWKDLFEKESAA